MGCQKVIEIINRYNNFLISSHKNPELDAIGSELALASLLTRMNKDVRILNEDALCKDYRFLPGTEQILQFPRDVKFDVLIVLDCPNLDRIGKIADLITEDTVTVNIDHHISNQKFAKINWINPSASCVGEMIYDLFHFLGCSLNRGEALCLYVAILTDTGSFKFANTTSKTHKVASRLLNWDLRPDEIYRKIYAQNSLSYVRFLAKAFNNLELSRDGKVAWFKLAKQTLKFYGIKLERSGDLLDFALSVKGVRVAILFRQIARNKVKVSFRSDGSIDVNFLANVFGGGGHVRASGCTIPGTLNGAEKEVFKQIKRLGLSSKKVK